mmetsp:Transcript_89169/g.257066  ORF Transcript_89169/g.257066 Transcript_89169/m.257066 type:complete len:103 (-) Transcript_89169:112-420(-)|eukprot:CAMPEP_0176089870 /NCGR_PEP_ID=MMETSP0120_2-20121206/45010_1 /TAXON_ID=160619 /ORGANISM="Kryptoperidinium foliaceum, Strain CCMP 1326" /LENGTH=102 /DNA_ID=CAMNT_0017423753 /DNA_START=79 /DNA_END=387 /DNA_ORIENTATION=-
MRASVSFVAALLVAVSCLVSTIAFAPKPLVSVNSNRAITHLNIFDGDKERDALTRDSEPEDYFQTNTDKMSDEEKIPIAVAGLVGISLPFILGLIALYAAKG